MNPQKTFRQSKSLALTLTIAVVVWALSTGVIHAATAPDGPGSLSHFDLARKDCLGTAENTTSTVWFTIANGVLSDVYYPTNDNTNVETLQYVVTDGSTFVSALRDLQPQHQWKRWRWQRQRRCRLGNSGHLVRAQRPDRF